MRGGYADTAQGWTKSAPFLQSVYINLSCWEGCLSCTKIGGKCFECWDFFKNIIYCHGMEVSYKAEPLHSPIQNPGKIICNTPFDCMLPSQRAHQMKKTTF